MFRGVLSIAVATVVQPIQILFAVFIPAPHSLPCRTRNSACDFQYVYVLFCRSSCCCSFRICAVDFLPFSSTGHAQRLFFSDLSLLLFYKKVLKTPKMYFFKRISASSILPKSNTFVLFILTYRPFHYLCHFYLYFRSDVTIFKKV